MLLFNISKKHREQPRQSELLRMKQSNISNLNIMTERNYRSEPLKLATKNSLGPYRNGPIKPTFNPNIPITPKERTQRNRTRAATPKLIPKKVEIPYKSMIKNYMKINNKKKIETNLARKSMTLLKTESKYLVNSASLKGSSNILF